MLSASDMHVRSKHQDLKFLTGWRVTSMQDNRSSPVQQACLLSVYLVSQKQQSDVIRLCTTAIVSPSWRQWSYITEKYQSPPKRSELAFFLQISYVLGLVFFWRGGGLLLVWCPLPFLCFFVVVVACFAFFSPPPFFVVVAKHQQKAKIPLG